MLSSKLVEMIEGHTEQIKRNVLKEVRKDSRLSEFTKLSDTELLRRFEDVCRHLGRWLSLQDEKLLENRYAALGRERFEEGIPLQEVVLATQMFKGALLRFAREQAVDQSAFDIYSEEELEYLLGRFFDRIIYYIVCGYQQPLREAARMTA